MSCGNKSWESSKYCYESNYCKECGDNMKKISDKCFKEYLIDKNSYHVNDERLGIMRKEDSNYLIEKWNIPKK
jgi:hypothetical protein